MIKYLFSKTQTRIELFSIGVFTPLFVQGEYLTAVIVAAVCVVVSVAGESWLDYKESKDEESSK